MTTFEPPADAITITFPQPAALLNMNSREHWAPKARKVAVWRRAAFFAAAAQLRGRRPFGMPPSYFMIELDVPDKRRRDPANYHATGKCALDGLVDSRRCWPDDTPDWVTTLEPRLRHSPDRLVTIHIWPRDGAA